MNRLLAFDTETTGLPLFSEPSEDPRQPHLVQLAAHLVDIDSRKTVASMDVIIRPEGWTIPDEVAAIHGITTEKAMDLGVGEHVALNMFLDLWGCAGFRLAHNEPFDARIVRIAIMRHAGQATVNEQGLPLADFWKAGAAECTAKLATPLCAIPPTERMRAARRFHHKTPNLTEAYTHFYGVPFDGAHSANSDVLACLAVYWAIKDAEASGVAKVAA